MADCGEARINRAARPHERGSSRDRARPFAEASQRAPESAAAQAFNENGVKFVPMS